MIEIILFIFPFSYISVIIFVSLYNGQTEHIVITVAAEENLTNKEKRLGSFFLAFFLKAISCSFLRLSLSM